MTREAVIAQINAEMDRQNLTWNPPTWPKESGLHTAEDLILFMEEALLETRLTAAHDMALVLKAVTLGIRCLMQHGDAEA